MKRIGTGGESIYGPTFDDENFEVKHTEGGFLSNAHRGPNTQSSQFSIMHTATPWLDGVHTIFGKIKTGMEVVREIEKVETAG